MGVVDVVAVVAVLESRSECSDAARASAALDEAMVAARAPAHGGRRLRGSRSTTAPASSSSSSHVWTVTMAVVPRRLAGRGAPTSVDARIVDDTGHVVAQRTISDHGARSCLPLARAVGAWATLVLDAEMNRATDDDGGEASDDDGSRAVTNSVGRASVGFARPSPDHPLESSTEQAADHVEQAPAAVPRRAVELGSMVYLRSGMTTIGGVTGLAPFVTVEVASGWVLRPGLFFGRSTAAQDSTLLSHLGARVDFCRRIPGNYIERRGIEVDLCAGAEGGVVTADGPGPEQESTGRMGIGPSANLRGELGAGLALELRGLVGANMIRYASLTPLAFVSGELGVSVRLP